MDCVLIILGFMVLCYTVQVQGTCGRRVFSRRQPRVMGGGAALKGEIPWIGSLKYSGTHYCGVTIYDKRYLVGAAHCFDEHYETENWTVAFGQHNISQADNMTVFAKIENIAIHPNYSQSSIDLNHDIAVLRLKEDIIFNAFIQPACLPDAELVDGTVATVAGWGMLLEKTEIGYSFRVPEVLQKVHMDIYKNSNCKNVLQKIWHEVTIPESQVCAGWTKGGRYIQEGDSGGGLYSEKGGKWTVAGITSHNKRNGLMEGDIPGVFTRVNSYTKWIREMSTENEI